jgi:hypothetical protein
MSQLTDLLAARTALPGHDPAQWQLSYDAHPYLSNLTVDELNARYGALAQNLAFLLCPSSDALPLAANYHSSLWWLLKFEQTRHEYMRRGSKPPEVPDYPEHVAVALNQSQPGGDPDFVVRYGERSWLMAMIEKGDVRIAPARSYEVEVASARRDDELEKAGYLLKDSVRITTEDGKTIRPKTDVRRSVRMSSNYYVLCASTGFDPRLAAYFPNKAGDAADACAVIFDVGAFAERLAAASSARLSGWFFHHNPVWYYDPRDIKLKQYLSAGTHKDFAFAYQREYRFLWAPVSGGDAVDYIHLDLGPLGDIAGLFTPAGEHLAGRRA